MNDRRVVVTGLGTVNPVGADVPATWSALVEGRSGIGPITLIDASDLTSQIAGEVSNFDIEAFMPRRQARRMDRFAQLFWVAAREALADAGIAYDDGDP
ncbi:MAG TPA: beta-ketoacyl synthase N-terminal-like domain-containing protein, partial [Acidimicrobiia bacterium]|nr:beta-ketoacyl synthase N-terminal-like domain-containing protein [Acidimicrobiia bacterium]